MSEISSELWKYHQNYWEYHQNYGKITLIVRNIIRILEISPELLGVSPELWKDYLNCQKYHQNFGKISLIVGSNWIGNIAYWKKKGITCKYEKS